MMNRTCTVCGIGSYQETSATKDTGLLTCSWCGAAVYKK